MSKKPFTHLTPSEKYQIQALYKSGKSSDAIGEQLLLLDYLHKIGSDVQLEKMLARDLLFRKFCGIGLDQHPPSHDTISRFRRELAAVNVWEALLEEVNTQLSANHLLIQEGQVSIMDATVVEAHQIKGGTKDKDADWSVKNNSRGKKTSTYGYKIHSNCDEDGFILKQTVTAGNEYDGNQRDALLTGRETQLYADSVYDSAPKRNDLDKRGIENRVQRKALPSAVFASYKANNASIASQSCCHRPLTDEDHAWNKEVGVTRARIEHPFTDIFIWFLPNQLPLRYACGAGYKERFGIKRTRFMGLDMNTTYAGLRQCLRTLFIAGVIALLIYALQVISKVIRSECKKHTFCTHAMRIAPL